jgi:transcriptional regulator with XRE-family HTH domain
VETNEEPRGNPQFGAYLKRVREGRRLSLDAVEELSAGFPEKVTKSHLSRIENGLALPTFPRLMAMSHIYGVPIASLAERYEIDLRRGMTPVDLGGKSDDDIVKDVDALRAAGRHNEALVKLLALIDAHHPVGAIPTGKAAERAADLKIRVITCLVQLGRYEFAKTMCEDLLGAPLDVERRLEVILHFAICCFRLGRHSVALMALDQVASDLDSPGVARRIAADLAFVRGNVFLAMGVAEQALPNLQRAVALYDSLPNDHEACRAGVTLGEVLIQLDRHDEAAAILRTELDRAERNGFERSRALALSHMSLQAYRLGDLASSESFALRSNAIARGIEHNVVVFRNCYYLWEIAKQRGDASATKLNERTLRSYLGRIEARFSEAQSFREFVERGES